MLAVISKWSRLERWLYNGLHSLDFAFWYHQRPLWDIGVILLLLGGLGLSVFGLVVGVKRLLQDLRALLARLKQGRSPVSSQNPISLQNPVSPQDPISPQKELPHAR